MRKESWKFRTWEVMAFIVNLCHLTKVSLVELPCECLLQLTMETNPSELMILLLFGWRMYQQAVSRSASYKVVGAIEVTSPSIGSHSKVPNQEYNMERPVSAFLLLERNAIRWHFLRYDWRLSSSLDLTYDTWRSSTVLCISFDARRVFSILICDFPLNLSGNNLVWQVVVSKLDVAVKTAFWQTCFFFQISEINFKTAI